MTTKPYFSIVSKHVDFDFEGKTLDNVIKQLTELKQQYSGRTVFFVDSSDEYNETQLQLWEFHRDRVPQGATHYTLRFSDITCLSFYKVRDVAGHPTWFQYRVGTKPGTFEWMHQGDHRDQFLIPIKELDRVFAES